VEAGVGRTLSKAMLALAHRQPSVAGGHTSQTLSITHVLKGDSSGKEGEATQQEGASSSLDVARANSILLRPDGENSL
jgi:hypothetical protein